MPALLPNVLLHKDIYAEHMQGVMTIVHTYNSVTQKRGSGWILATFPRLQDLVVCM